VRVAPCLIVAASFCLAVVGCSHTNRRQGNSSDGVFMGAGPAAGGAKKAESTDPIFNTSAPSPDIEGMLAGPVLDSASGQPIAATIRCVCLDEGKGEDSAPIDIATDARGNYIIQGLKSGKRYKLTAKARQDGRNLVGVKYTLAPNPRAVIKLQEDLAPRGDGGPPPPAPPAAKAPEKSAEPEKKTSSLPSPERQASAQVPVPGWGPAVGALPVPAPGASPGVGIRQPVPLGPPPSAGGPPGWDRPAGVAPTPVRPLAPERIAEQDRPRPRMPVMDIRDRQQPSPRPEGPTPVPSAAVLGTRVVNFALYDLNNQPWEYRRDKRGKLVLLDFWSTSCPPCLKTIPALRSLKESYGPRGLEVVAIAYEQGGTPAEQAQRVQTLAQRLGLNGTLLLGSGPQCPVQTQFRVPAYPTLVLLDENGDIIWYHTGQPEAYQVGELERTIRMKLNLNQQLSIR
jgi:thiol-disulfide isomerase/thioredoxin